MIAAAVAAAECVSAANNALLSELFHSLPDTRRILDGVSVLELVDDTQETPRYARVLAFVLDKRREADYEQRRLRKSEARQMVPKAEKFVEWVAARLA